MLEVIAVFLLAMGWLCFETDFLRVRLPYGQSKSNSYIECLTQMMDNEWIEVEKYLTIKPIIPQLAQFCERTKHDNEFKNSRCKPKYNHYRQSFQQMTIGNSTFRLNPTLSNLHDFIKDVEKVQSEKHKPKQIAMGFPSMEFIKTIKTGSEKKQFGMRGGRKHYEYVDTTKLEFYDCLCGKEWLEAHYKDEYPEPIIELEVNDKTFCVNGNYKKRLITEYMMGKAKKSKQNKMIEVN